MGTINSNPLDHAPNFGQNNFSSTITDNYNIMNNYVVSPLTVGDFISTPRQGWQCPCCGRVYSPDTPMCWYCGNKGTITSTTIPCEEKESNANVFKNEIDYDDLFNKRVTFDKTEEITTYKDGKTIHDVAKLFVHTKTPKKIMIEMNYAYDETQSLETNTRFFLKEMEKVNRLEELYNLLKS